MSPRTSPGSSPVVIDLGGDGWELTEVGADERYPAVVPGSVHVDLLAAGVIDDPYWRENEAAIAWIGDRDWRYTTRFDVAADVFEHAHHLLRFHGLDTLALVALNGKQILAADNMHRQWDVDVTSLLQRSGNELTVTFASANAEIRRRQSAHRLPGWYGISSIEGAGWLRKQLSNFGWDWGPSLVTAGIWRPVELVAWDDVLLTDVDIAQRHGDGAVALDVTVSSSEPLPNGSRLSVELHRPDGALAASAVADGGSATVDVPEPQLWWPNGLGEQPLYTVDVAVLRPDGAVAAAATRRIGLRILRLVREADADGETFGFECNGVPFFAKGANWIPADAVVGRVTADTLRSLVFDAAAANMNMLRVWGGNVYEEDAFYDACDEAGICVWQDAAFACVTFPSFEPAYVDNVKAELADNIRRLRHHPSLALWCGNNELEMGLVGDTWNDWQMAWDDYIPFMDDELGSVVRALDPQRDYWPGSPHTPGEGRKESSNSPAAGDAHLWTVWHGGQPGTWYRTSTHRFISEFGFQSYPHPATMAAVTEPSDRDLAHPVIDAHQKATAAGASGNAELARQLVRHFRTPKSWDGLIWQTQLLQSLTVTTGLEHWRRSLDRTRGALYWQLNDCWPGPSWSSVDYFGHWKALHYAAKRAFAPVMLSLLEDANTFTVEVHVTNESRDSVTVPVEWTVVRTDGEVVATGAEKVTVEAQLNQRVLVIDSAAHVEANGARDILVFATIPDLPEQRAMTAFVPAKHLSLQDAQLSVTRDGDRVTVTATRPAPWVWLDAGGSGPLRLSDNFFAMLPGSYSVSAESAVPAGDLRVLSLLDTVETWS